VLDDILDETKETYKYHDHKDKLLKRLKKLEGPVRGVRHLTFFKYLKVSTQLLFILILK
jgi:hypothetical protein